jgi:hypothetical protein
MNRHSAVSAHEMRAHRRAETNALGYAPCEPADATRFDNYHFLSSGVINTERLVRSIAPLAMLYLLPRALGRCGGNWSGHRVVGKTDC